MCLLLYALSGPAWDWDRWYKVSLWSVIGLILGLVLKALDFSTFFDDPRNGFDSFPWQWVVFLLLVILALTAIGSFLPKRLAPAPTSAKEIKHVH
jgi:hypothetical protein